MLTSPAGAVHQPPTVTQPSGKRREQHGQQQSHGKDGNKDGDKVAYHAWDYTTSQFSMP